MIKHTPADTPAAAGLATDEALATSSFDVEQLADDTPIARIVPYAPQPLEIRKAQRRVRDLKLPPKPAKRTDSVAVLLEDRRRR